MHFALHILTLGVALYTMQGWFLAEMRADNWQRGYESAREVTESIYRTIGRGAQPAFNCRWKKKYRNWRGEVIDE